MKKLLKIAGATLLLALIYAFFWPVPIDPVAWHAPEDRGLVDPYAPNDFLQAATAIDLGHYEGPEDATLGYDNSVYLTTSAGRVLRVRNRKVEEFAVTDGRPLGIEAARDGSLIVANAYAGVQASPSSTT